VERDWRGHHEGKAKREEPDTWPLASFPEPVQVG
jgi:hypothetical protein